MFLDTHIMKCIQMGKLSRRGLHSEDHIKYLQENNGSERMFGTGIRDRTAGIQKNVAGLRGIEC